MATLSGTAGDVEAPRVGEQLADPGSHEQALGLVPADRDRVDDDEEERDQRQRRRQAAMRSSDGASGQPALFGSPPAAAGPPDRWRGGRGARSAQSRPACCIS